MKRLVPFFVVLSICLLACLGWVAGRPQTVSANFMVDGGHGDDHNGDKDRDKDHDKDRGDDHSCRADDRDQEGRDQSDRKHDGEGEDDHSDHDARLGSFLTTITKYGTGGAVATRSVITLHRDHTMSVIDSGQGGPGTQFSSQLGSWKGGCDEEITGRTLDFSFPSAGISRLDYKFDPDQPKDTIKGLFILTTFPLNADPQVDTGTVVGQFEFTGTRIKAQ